MPISCCTHDERQLLIAAAQRKSRLDLAAGMDLQIPLPALRCVRPVKSTVTDV